MKWFLLGLFGMCCATLAGDNAVRVLIVDGFGNHDWQHTTRCIQSILKQSPEFQVSVSTFPATGSPDEIAGWNPRFADYHVVIQTCNDIRSGIKWSENAENALSDYVASGGGLFVFHSANNAFPDWLEYNRMIGLGWRNKNFGWAITVNADGEVIRIPAGEGENTSHGKRVDALITRLGNHPIHKGFPRQWVAADIEIYRYARGPAENMLVLSYARDEQTGLNFPIEWTVAYGEGRIYNSTFGHVWKNQAEPEGMRCAGFQTLIPRIIQWLAGRPVESVLPKDFPGDEQSSLRPYPE